MTANQINYAKLKEEQRSNLVQEELGRRQAAVAERNATTNEFNAQTNRYSLDIQREANAIQAANVAEQIRTHQVNEEISRTKVAQDYSIASARLGNETASTESSIKLQTWETGEAAARASYYDAQTEKAREEAKTETSRRVLNWTTVGEKAYNVLSDVGWHALMATSGVAKAAKLGGALIK